MLWCACRLRTRIAHARRFPRSSHAPDIPDAAGFGIDAVINDVNFNFASDLVLLEVNGERVKRRRLKKRMSSVICN